MLKLKKKHLAMLLAPTLAFAAAAATAQTPVGRWKTVDDATGVVKSIVEITQAPDGSLSGRVDEILQSDDGPDPLCKKCSGDRQNQPITGMTIFWDLQPDGNEWSGGTILDPVSGKTYKAKAKMVSGDQFGVSGCIAFICREQVWQRE